MDSDILRSILVECRPVVDAFASARCARSSIRYCRSEGADRLDVGTVHCHTTPDWLSNVGAVVNLVSDHFHVFRDSEQARRDVGQTFRDVGRGLVDHRQLVDGRVQASEPLVLGAPDRLLKFADPRPKHPALSAVGPRRWSNRR